MASKIVSFGLVLLIFIFSSSATTTAPSTGGSACESVMASPLFRSAAMAALTERTKNATRGCEVVVFTTVFYSASDAVAHHRLSPPEVNTCTHTRTRPTSQPPPCARATYMRKRASMCLSTHTRPHLHQHPYPGSPAVRPARLRGAGRRRSAMLRAHHWGGACPGLPTIRPGPLDSGRGADNRVGRAGGEPPRCRAARPRGLSDPKARPAGLL